SIAVEPFELRVSGTHLQVFPTVLDEANRVGVKLRRQRHQHVVVQSTVLTALFRPGDWDVSSSDVLRHRPEPTFERLERVLANNVIAKGERSPPRPRSKSVDELADCLALAHRES